MVDSNVNYERCMEAASMALSSGDRAAAERAFRAAIQSIEAFEGAQLELASVLIKLGTLKQEMSSYVEAEEFFRKALDVSERALGSYDLGLVPALTGLGTARILHGAPEQAEPVLARALTIAESHLGEDHPDLVILINDLTRLYLKQSAYSFAEPLLLRLLAMKRSKGEDHPEVATVLASLAAVRQALGRYEAAEQLWRRVLTIRERTLAPNHFSLATSLEHLAETCSARGKVREALQLLQRAHTIRETTLGADHPSLRTSRERIADLQLQASEDAHDPLEPASDRPRLSLSDPLRISAATPAPAREQSAPKQEIPAPFVVEQEPSTRRAPTEKVPAPAAVKSASAARVESAPSKAAAPERAKPAPAKLATPEKVQSAAPSKTVSADPIAHEVEPVPYLDVLNSIKEELEDIDERQGSNERGAPLFTTVSAFISRRPTATIGIGAAALLLVALTVVAARSSSASGWVEQPQLPAARPAVDSVALAAAALPPVVLAGNPAKDSSAGGTSTARAVAPRPRADDRAAATRAESDEPTLGSVVIPTLRLGSAARLDSAVRANSAPAFAIRETFPITLASSPEAQRSIVPGVEPAAPQRARLIGQMPVPEYPSQMMQARVRGEVRIRFDVDSVGRPIMATFAVVSSPHPQLTASVRNVIAAMRFEPARTPWPEFKPVGERIEMGFQFTPPSR
jgi:TonB family protein